VSRRKTVIKNCHQTEELLNDAPDNAGYIPPERVRTAVTWMTGVEARKAATQPLPEGSREDPPLIPRQALVVLKLFRQTKQVTWHAKGDYFATVCPDGANRAVLIHQLSKWRSQVPFTKAKGLVQCVLFHPVKPYFFVATQRHVRIYNLTKLELTKKLMTGAKWISSMAIHSHGDNVLVSVL
jgi:ribosome biogenesis protein ERB1